MSIALRLTLLGVCASLGVALAVSLAEAIPDLTEAAPAPPAAADARADGQPTAEGRPAKEAATTEKPAEPQRTATAPPAAHPLRDAARPSTEALTTIAPPVLPDAAPAASEYQAAFTQEIDTLQRTIRNLRDSSDLQHAQLRSAIDTLNSRPQAPLHVAQFPFSQSFNQQAEEPAGPDKEVKREVHPGEGDGRLVLNLKNADLREVLDLMGQHADLNILPSPNVQGTVSASLNNVDIHTALDAVLTSNGFAWRADGPLIYVGTRADLEEIDRSRDRIATRVYRPNYVTAAEVQNLIANMLTPGVGAVTVSTPAENDIPADNVHTGGDMFAGQEVLLVRDYASVLHEIDQVVREVDVQPLQVSIEAMILSVDLDDDHELGVNFELLRQNENIRVVSGNAFNAIADLTFDGGLKVGFLDSNLAAFINALERIGQTNVIAKPHLLCLNKQRAEILIGEQLGYVSTTVTENAATQSVEFLEVGTQLRIRPFIASDGTIRMEVHPELSTGNVRVEQNFTLPDKDVTQVTTNIMCRDGATIVIGGLIREDLATTNSQIPVLGNLPLVGPMFRQQTETTSKEELIVLITPRIIRTPEAYYEGADAQRVLEQHQADFADKMSPTGKRYWGRQYLRKARAAWNAGDAYTALRYANLAIHWDPQSIEASALREEIVTVSGVGDDSIHRHLNEGLPPWEHPKHEYSRRGYPWKTPPPEGYVEGIEPIARDLGQVGDIRTLESVRPSESRSVPSTELLPAP